MAEVNIYKHVPVLLSKAITGTLTEGEACQLETWRAGSEEHARLYEEVIHRDFIGKKCEEVASVDLVRGYMNVMARRKHRVQVRRVKRILSVAAGILLPLIGTLLWVGDGNDKRVQVPGPVPATIKSGTIKAELILADGTTKFLDATVTDSLYCQSGANILVKDKSVSYQKDTTRVSLQYNTLRVPRGGEYSVTLSDGTVVYLNSESELHYPVKFVGEERRVHLSGEAYFDVKSDKHHPFIVELENSSVRVLGTGFDVRAYKDEDRVMTTLVQGVVAFSSGKEEVILAPGEQGVLKSGGIEKCEVDTYLYTAWKDGVFAFRQQRLEEIMRIVARWYNVNIFWDNVSQKDVTFTGKMRRYDDFSKIVEMLEMTGNTEFKIKENNIFIREKN